MNASTPALLLLLAGLAAPALAQDLDPSLQRQIDQAVARALATPPAPPAKADEAYLESNVVSLVGREGFRFQDKDGRFLFNPYVLAQTRFQFQKVSDTGLELSDPDTLTSVGFGVTNAILGVAGKAFGKLSFNLALNGALSGGALLNETWLEGNLSDALRVRVGKFKTPMHWSVQTRLGGRLAPFSPTSLTSRVNIPADINAVNPTLATGFDVGLMVHGLLGGELTYQVGVFNGEGIGLNQPTSTLSDDSSLPALLYSGRLAWTPLGALPLEEGGLTRPLDLRLLVGASASLNVETNAESSDDLRAGLELVLSGGRWYWASEAYVLRMRFTERMEETPDYVFWGGYTLLSRAFESGLEPFLRLDALDRNSTHERGLLLLPGAGLNWYLYEQNLKLQAMYQYSDREQHQDRLAADDDIADLGLHTFSTQLQFAF